MIKTLKRKFIILAMVSLTVLLAVIVTGMNIINYQKVVSDADSRLEVLEQNSERLLRRPDGLDFDGGANGAPGQPEDSGEFYFGRDGRGGPRMTMDEAEEARFFTVVTDADGNVKQTNINRISAVDRSEAGEYAEKALASGESSGFVDEFRYSVETEDGESRITFLDCGRTLESFRAFMRASILMSVCGLLIMFAVISYFAGRIVSPVAESYEKQKRFITDAGHEIKTPLAIIKANIDLMNMEIDGAEIAVTDADDLRESLGDIDEQVDRLTGLTNDLVYLSRMEEAGGSLVMTEVPMSDLAADAADAFEPLARDRGKSIETDIEPMLTVQGSTKELEKLLSIILENAVKYSAKAGSGEDEEAAPIKMRLKKDGRNAVLEVSNQAETELDNESLSHVFERFYRTDSSRNSQTGGHGIGLSMASAIVSAHKGRIAARTTDGHDFIVTASIPLA